MKRVLITGASGMLGRALYKEMGAYPGQWQLLGLAYSRLQPGYQKCDLTDPQQIKETFQDFKPDVVVHCAAERRPDVVEKDAEATIALNVKATEDICTAADECGAYVVYLSTDYVFDGNNPPYEVDATPNPLNTYGKTKLEGEKVVSKVSKDNIILRVPILYGEVEFVEESAVTIIFKQVLDTSKEQVSDDYARRFPTFVGDIAVVIRQLLEKRKQDDSLNGIFHWSSEECFTKYTMATAMADVFNLPKDHLKGDQNAPTGGAPRPYDAHLSSRRLDALGIGKRTPFNEAIKFCLEKFAKN